MESVAEPIPRQRIAGYEGKPIKMGSGLKLESIDTPCNPYP